MPYINTKVLYVLMFNVTLISRKMPPPPTQPRCQRKQNTVAYNE